MKKQLIFSLSVIFSLCFSVPAAGQTQTSESNKVKKPNIVLIVADDLGYRDVSCYGCKDFSTPNIDKLARNGIRLTSGYVTHPYCSPSRAGILTGMYQHSFGHEHNPRYDENDQKTGIDKSTTLLPKILSENGYKTGLIGKWHLGAGKPFRPNKRGFNQFYGFLGGGHDYFGIDPNYLKKPRQGSGYLSPLWKNNNRTDDKITYLTDDLTRAGEEFIEKNKDQPFFLAMMYNAPHAPDQVTKRLLQKVSKIPNPGRRRYAALVQGLDEGVGRLTRKLEKLGLHENTMVIFLSDNGGRRGVSDNRPLRGNKGWLHEGGIRVPFIISLPSKLKKSQVYKKPIVGFDILPTALAAAEIEIPKSCAGKNVLPYLSGKNTETPHDTIYWRVSGGKGYAIRKGDWKLVHDIGMDRPQLYNLSEDLGENHDLSSSHTEKLSSLLNSYQSWSAKQETPRWTEGHTKNAITERKAARKAGTRQFPMKWTQPDK